MPRHQLYRSMVQLPVYGKKNYCHTEKQSTRLNIKFHIKALAASRHLWLLMGVFFLVQAVLFYKTGVVTTLEAEKYIREGMSLATSGTLTETRFIFYLPVILLIAFCRLLHLPLEFVVLVQVLVSAVALYSFYRMALHLSTRNWALGISIVLACFIPIQEWNMYLYSDSLFISISVIFFSLLYFYSINNKIRWWVFILLPLAWCFARPAGLLFVLPLFILLLAARARNKIYIMGLLAAMLAMVLFAAAYFNGGGDLDTLKPYIEEHIICFVPQNEAGAQLTIVHTGNQLNDLLYYIVHNPGHFTSLLFKKIVSFFNLTRPWYSSAHNLALMMFMIPLYLFFLPGMIYLFRYRRPFAWFVLAVMIIYPVGVALQCDDWHSRFTMPVLPLMMLVAFYGLITLIKKKGKQP